MDASTNGHDRTHPEEDELPTGWRWTLPRALGILAFLLMVVFWIWVFANRDSIVHPDQFDDVAFSQAAEEVCATRQANIAAFPSAVNASGPIERAELVAQGSRELELMVNELAALAPPAETQAADGVRQWIGDYRLYISDRETWTAKLAAGEDDPFLLSANAQGGRVTDLLRTFAEVNNMPSCTPTGDV